MSSLAIWGTPLPGGVAERCSESRASVLRVPIERQISTFLRGQIADYDPDLIIVHERKGTATLRALKESSDRPLEYRWNNVVSSTAVDQLPNDFFINKRILIFDDMMRTGAHLSTILDALVARGIVDHRLTNVRVATFATHEDIRDGRPIGAATIPNTWFYRDLTTSAYRMIRSEIVSALQDAGSLMLDTEHIEVRIRLHCSLTRLIRALSRLAETIVFRSSEDRTNITVWYPDDSAHMLPAAPFPAGTGLTGIVKKCRVVQRDTDEFAIIPICLPSIVDEASAWPVNSADARLLGIMPDASPLVKFYAVALISSLYPLSWILRDLYASDPSAFTLSLPRKHEDGSSSGYSLEHLRVMYPRLDVGLLAGRIAETQRTAESDGRRRRHIKAESHKAPVVDDSELRGNALHLLQVISHTIDQRRAGAYVEAACHETCPRGLEAKEIFQLGRRLGWNESRISALFDILIDDANLVTRVERTRDDEGVYRWTRTFRPDGEVVSELVRHYTAQWGLPRGF